MRASQKLFGTLFNGGHKTVQSSFPKTDFSRFQLKQTESKPLNGKLNDPFSMSGQMSARFFSGKKSEPMFIPSQGQLVLKQDLITKVLFDPKLVQTLKLLESLEIKRFGEAKSKFRDFQDAIEKKFKGEKLNYHEHALWANRYNILGNWIAELTTLNQERGSKITDGSIDLLKERLETYDHVDNKTKRQQLALEILKDDEIATILNMTAFRDEKEIFTRLSEFKELNLKQEGLWHNIQRSLVDKGRSEGVSAGSAFRSLLNIVVDFQHTNEPNHTAVQMFY